MAVTVAAAIASLATRHRPGLSSAIAAAGFGLGLVVASGVISPLGGPLRDGVVDADFARAYLVAGAAAGAVVTAIAAAVGPNAWLPAGFLLALGAAAVAFASPAAWPATVAGAAALAASMLPAAGAASVRAEAAAQPVAIRPAWSHLRAVGVAAALALAAVAMPHDAAAGGAGTPPAALGWASLAVAVAVVLGATPFHLGRARLLTAVSPLALVVALVWAPAAFAAVAVAATGPALGSVAALPAERALLVGCAVVTVGLATVAALVHDDVPHVVAYSVIADGALVLLALAAVQPATGAALTWLLAWAAGKTALLAWAAVVRLRAPGERLHGLTGWAWRAPVLAAALALVSLAAVGWPGTTVWEARRAVVGSALTGPLGHAVLVASLATVAIHVRLLAGALWRPRRREGPFDEASGEPRRILSRRDRLRARARQAAGEPRRRAAGARRAAAEAWTRRRTLTLGARQGRGEATPAGPPVSPVVGDLAVLGLAVVALVVAATGRVAGG